MLRPVQALTPVLALNVLCHVVPVFAQPPSAQQVQHAIESAVNFYHTQVATHGGYVYHYSLDLQQRWGEGVASADQIWVQPPGTPTVGLAYLKAYEATSNSLYLDAAKDAALALVYGQIQSGGWTNCIDFNPRGERVALYRNGKGKGRNTSSLDDGQTSTALRFLIRADQALEFKQADVHAAATTGLEALLAAQYPCGAFPQIWDGTKTPNPPGKKANYPDYDWRTEGRIKEYWHMYTLNDNVPGYVAATLIAAHEVYHDEKYLASLRKLGDFLLLAHMPDPQPGWAQQYNYEMQPVWARKFEPPGVSGDETQETIETLMRISLFTGDRKYLEPIPAALGWLRKSLLPDGRLARYYELKTNRPLYMTRNGETYTLTFDDSNLPDHYGWKTESRIAELTRLYKLLNDKPTAGLELLQPPPLTAIEIQQIVQALDEQGRWVSTYRGGMLVGQPRFRPGTSYLSSAVFSQNIERLSEWLIENRVP